MYHHESHPKRTSILLHTQEQDNGTWRADVYLADRPRKIGLIGGASGYASEEEAMEAAKKTVAKHYRI